MRSPVSSPGPGPMLHVHNLSFGGDLLGGSKAPVAKSPLTKSRKRTPSKRPAAAKLSQHGLCQTEPVLLEALQFPTEDAVCVQTDTFMKQLAPPSDMLLKRGVDAATSIEPGDLWEFDREVAPLLEKLVGTALEAAHSAAEDELRLGAIRQRRRVAEQVRYQALLEVQRMEGDNRRREEARLRQQQEDAERERRQRELERKLVALALARDMVKGAVDNTAAMQPADSRRSSQASLGSAAERAVMGYLGAAGTASLQAMRRASTPRIQSRAPSRLLSRDPARSSTAPSAGTSPAAESSADIGRSTSSVSDVPSGRPATAVADELVGNMLRQVAAEAEAAPPQSESRPPPVSDSSESLILAAYRPTTAQAQALVQEAMQQVQKDVMEAVLGSTHITAQEELASKQGVKAAAEARPATALAAKVANTALAEAVPEAAAYTFS